jgi:RNA polymerase sigma-54 factor
MTMMDMRADHRQGQTPSPRLQHAVRLLQMSSLDFSALVRDALDKNPFLETDEGGDGPGGVGADSLGQAAASASVLPCDGTDTSALQAPVDSGLGGDSASPFDDLGRDADDATQGGEGGMADDGGYGGDASDRDLWSADVGGAARGGGEGGLSALDMMAVETSLTTHLHGQLNLLPLPLRDLLLARTVVESLDDDGYLRTPLHELIEVAELDPPATPDEMQIALRRVQSLEPDGVAARSVCECLQLQLPAIACPDMRALARSIVCDHLAAMAARDVAGLARTLSQTPARIEAVFDRIRRLDPRPGWRYGSTQVAYVVPDVIVRKVRGQWSVQLNPAVVPKVRLNRVCEALFERHRSAQNTEMTAHLNEARWTVRNVEQRFLTILDVANVIVRKQKSFLEYGAMAMKPLGLKQIADEVGIHESTVSRVTNNKYMATPVGVFELKYFFSRAMPTASGAACSGIAIRSLLKDIIDAESPDDPLSDADITRQFAQQGLVVARRTVTKYRQMLKIEAVDRRRRHAAVA